METQFNIILIYDVSGTELSVIQILTRIFLHKPQVRQCDYLCSLEEETEAERKKATCQGHMIASVW